MDLWIRSQNKTTLCLTKDIRADGKSIICYGYTDTVTNIGVYATHERALEVLDEIQKFLREINRYDFFVYEMPEDKD